MRYFLFYISSSGSTTSTCFFLTYFFMIDLCMIGLPTRRSLSGEASSFSFMAFYYISSSFFCFFFSLLSLMRSFYSPLITSYFYSLTSPRYLSWTSIFLYSYFSRKRDYKCFCSVFTNPYSLLNFTISVYNKLKKSEVSSLFVVFVSSSSYSSVCWISFRI